METTMHAHIEVKKNNKWMHYGCPDVTRNYLVFACVNGMRKGEFSDRPEIYERICPVARVDRIPGDISEVTRLCLESDSGDYQLKGFGMLDSDDLYRLQNLLWSFPGKYGDPDFDLEGGIFKTYINGGSIMDHRGFDDARVLFWFDN